MTSSGRWSPSTWLVHFKKYLSWMLESPGDILQLAGWLWSRTRGHWFHRGILRPSCWLPSRKPSARRWRAITGLTAYIAIELNLPYSARWPLALQKDLSTLWIVLVLILLSTHITRKATWSNRRWPNQALFVLGYMLPVEIVEWPFMKNFD